MSSSSGRRSRRSPTPSCAASAPSSSGCCRRATRPTPRSGPGATSMLERANPTYFREWKEPCDEPGAMSDALHGHLGRRPRGRVGSGVPRVPRVALARRVRRVGADLQQPVRGSRGIERVPQLGVRRARLAELEADGIVAEVLFPNTIPPFFPSGALVTPAPNAAEYEHRWAGLQAHNRWLADFCAAAPGPPRGRRADPAQRRRRRAAPRCEFANDAGLFGGVLLPGVPPNHEIPPLWSDVYEPLWALCEELDVVVNHHSGGGLPSLRPRRSRRARGDARRDPDLRAPRALALIFARRVRTPPAAASSC